MRRLPVYFLIDTSSSMGGEAIEAVRVGLDTLISALRQEPQALETAPLCVITFASEAKVVTPLTEITTVQIPKITARGKTALGAGLTLLAECIDTDVVKSTPEAKGDWKPLVFLMTDGGPSDDWRAGLARFKQCKVGTFVALALGRHVHMDVLQEITPDVVTADQADSGALKAYFKWVTSSISVRSQSVDRGQTDTGGLNQLPPPPPEINVVL
jgi:uncharacterized protein YegL